METAKINSTPESGLDEAAFSPKTGPAHAQRLPGDYASGQEVRWCPGCGDYSVLSQIKKVLSARNADPDKIAFISGIGCSSRFPYYMGTYGIHGIHGRALAVATGLRITRPDIQVWVATGDGDGLSIGGNHFLHTVRKNVDMKVVLFNNRIYGLTKGQASPTSELGKITVSSPYGTVDPPVAPISLALGCEATFVARSIDMNTKHLEMVLGRAADHKGIAFVEVYQNCVIFNSGAYQYAYDRAERDEKLLFLEHGKPLIFGKGRDKGIVLDPNLSPRVVRIGENGITEKDLIVHDEKSPSPALAFLLSRLTRPEFPEPVGVFRAVEAPTYEERIDAQIEAVQAKEGVPDLQSILRGGGEDTWRVE